MLIARILSPVHSLGPGERVCVWTQGCDKRCKGCISPELWPFSGKEIDENILANVIIQVAQKGNCNGITISGGDPFAQPKPLLKLLKLLRDKVDDILVYNDVRQKNQTRIINSRNQFLSAFLRPKDDCMFHR